MAHEAYMVCFIPTSLTSFPPTLSHAPFALAMMTFLYFSQQSKQSFPHYSFVNFYCLFLVNLAPRSSYISFLHLVQVSVQTPLQRGHTLTTLFNWSLVCSTHPLSCHHHPIQPCSSVCLVLGISLPPSDYQIHQSRHLTCLIHVHIPRAENNVWHSVMLSTYLNRWIKVDHAQVFLIGYN